MNNKNNNSELSSAEVAAHLAKELGGDAIKWRTWLANDRRRGRRLAAALGPGRPRYSREIVNAMVLTELARRRPSPEASQHPEPLPTVIPAPVAINGRQSNRRGNCVVRLQPGGSDAPATVELSIAAPIGVVSMTVPAALMLAQALKATALALSLTDRPLHTGAGVPA